MSFWSLCSSETCFVINTARLSNIDVEKADPAEFLISLEYELGGGSSMRPN